MYVILYVHQQQHTLHARSSILYCSSKSYLLFSSSSVADLFRQGQIHTFIQLFDKAHYLCSSSLIRSNQLDIAVVEFIVFCVYISLSPFQNFDNPVLIVTVYLLWDLDMCHSNVFSPMSFPLWAIYHNKLHKCLFTGHLSLLLMQIVFA